MKKKFYLMAAFATALAFTACTNDELMPVEENGNGLVNIEAEGVIEIAISNTGTGTTRAARPVASSAADNNVNRVQLVFLDADGAEVEGVKFSSVGTNADYIVSADGLISYTNAEVEEGTPGTTDRRTKVASIRVDGLTEETDYTIVAYGWNGDKFPYGEPALVAGEKYYQTGTHTLEGFDLEEVFAASVDATTTNKANTVDAEGKPVSYIKFDKKVEIKLTRQVAGMLAYFKNVPVYINGDTEKEVYKVTVEANASTTGFYFPASLYSDDELNGSNQTDGAVTLFEFVIPETAEKVQLPEDDAWVYEFDNDGTIYAKGYGGKVPENAKFAPNTLFGGRYILPYASHLASSTLTIKIWASVDGLDDGAISTTKVVKTNAAPSDGNFYQFDIRCNNFYSIGKKLAAGTTDGPDDDDPDDDDDPIDLHASDEITVLVNDAWSVIHDMEVE